MPFIDTIEKVDWDSVTHDIYSRTPSDVERALCNAGSGNIQDFMALVSPAAAPYLEQMAQLSHGLTQKRFGKTMQLYIPLYLSNACCNSCAYCGFSHKNQLKRRTLSFDQILEEAHAIKRTGFEHLLLVTGEYPKEAGFEYLLKAVELLRPHFSQISIEVQPMGAQEYAALSANGLNTVYVYQETYNRETYPTYHPTGPKGDYAYRLETPERIGKAQVHRVGLGVLLGLEDWRVDSTYLAMHLRYLQKNYWKTKYSVAFPRLRPHTGNFQPNFPVSDRELIQLITAYRIFDENVELALSTRESVRFRNNAYKLGITSMSAGSKTEPGGYANERKDLEQFHISDGRTPQEVADYLRNDGYEPVWKDWDKVLQ
ncbi:2-iminoacetate synthase ThiH [Perlabentimonas gracilis]|uniref:2-iminoacetate synthase ThiH n=1 Tax=Perlabentimonas gracilis TaxID=2715279 RepID=UPI00140D73D4|nr:2-iminoacetate synthase ThiH [Perlabentimonas gracilis]NHB67167.1 2-iminoacetate synthase ThiH [Perlabentimonas gracilis]